MTQDDEHDRRGISRDVSDRLAPSASTTSTSRSARALTVTSLMVRAFMDLPAFGSTAHAISPQSSARAIERVPRRAFSTSTRFETVRNARGVVETRATDVIIATAFDDISARARVSTTSMNRETSREDTARASRDVLDDPVAPEGSATLEYVVPRFSETWTRSVSPTLFSRDARR